MSEITFDPEKFKQFISKVLVENNSSDAKVIDNRALARRNPVIKVVNRNVKMPRNRGKGRRGNKKTKETTWRDVNFNDVSRFGRRAYRFFTNTEVKFFDTAFSAASVTSTPTITCLTLIDQGDTSSLRIGDSIRLTSFEYIFTARRNPNALTASDRVRFIFFKDMEQDGTIPTAAEVLATGADNGTIQLYNFSNVVNNKRFHIMEDIHCDLQELSLQVFATGLLQAGGSQTWHKKIEQKSHVKFSGAGATQTQQGAGSVHLLVVSSTASNAPVIDGRTRVTYIDD